MGQGYCRIWLVATRRRLLLPCVKGGGQGAASMELAAAIAVDVCVLEGSLEVEGWR